MDTPVRSFRKTRFFLRWSIRLGFVMALVLVGVFCGAFYIQIFHHFFLFPKQAAVWKERETQLTPVSLKTGWNEYRGVMHSHSEVSHDSEATPKEIAAALKKAKCQFICMSDHYVDGKADYSLGKKGIFDDILFIRGFEMKDGLMPWGLPDNTVFTNDMPSADMAKKVHELGGVTSVSHAEAWRPWYIQQLDAMEIYNIHTDLIFKGLGRYSRDEVAKEFLFNFRSYGDQTLRYMNDEVVVMLLKQKWDQQCLQRKITAIAANDIHQNVGIRGVYTDRDTFLLLDTGHNNPEKCIKEIKLNFFTRMLLSACLGPLGPNKQLFRIDADPYERSARLVNTHLLARDLSERSIIDAIRQGRAFVAFNMIGDASGFAYVAQSGEKKVTMGERIPLAPDLKLRAEAPLACKFTLVRNGETVTTQEGKTFEFDVKLPGKYRIEAALKAVWPMSSYLAWDSWIIANPIEVTAPPPEKVPPQNAPNAPKPAAAPPAAASPAPAPAAVTPPSPPAAPAAVAPPAPAASEPTPPSPPAAAPEATPPAPAPPAETPPTPPAAPPEAAVPAAPTPPAETPPTPPAAPTEVTPPAPAPPAETPPTPPAAPPETAAPVAPPPPAAQ